MDITTIITAVVSALASSGIIGGLLHYTENKRTKKLANDSTAADEWKGLYKQTLERSLAKSGTIEKLSAENNALTTENARLVLLKCTDVRCANRKPPFGTTE